jgi:CubicO group peptidase (beta-lactamase class C family)
MSLLALPLVLASGGCGDGHSGGNGEADERAAQVDAIVEPFTGPGKPALAVLVGRGKKVLFEKAYGDADIESGEPATLQHVFPLMSVSKSFTAVAILKLVDEGVMTLDDPVADYLPELAASYGSAVTIRHLLQHTSGFPPYDVPPLLFELLAISPTPSNEDVLTVLASHPPRAAPGETFLYDDGNFNMLALIVKRVSGESFSEFQQQNVFDPLGMADSYSSPSPRDQVAPFVTSYAAQPDGTFAPFDLLGDGAYYLYGAGDVVSTVDDMFRFHRALVTGKLVDAALVDEAFTPAQLNDGTEPAFFPFEPDATYGLGFILADYGDGMRVGHGGAYLGFRTYYLYLPEQDLSVMFLMGQDYDGFLYDIVLPVADVFADAGD